MTTSYHIKRSSLWHLLELSEIRLRSALVVSPHIFSPILIFLRDLESVHVKMPAAKPEIIVEVQET